MKIQGRESFGLRGFISHLIRICYKYGMQIFPGVKLAEHGFIEGITPRQKARGEDVAIRRDGLVNNLLN